MDWNLQFETRVKGGMPVTVCCVFSPSSSEEYSDVEDLWLEVRGRRAKWIEKALTDAEWERLYAEAFENGQWPNDEELPGTKLTPERWEEIFIAPQILRSICATCHGNGYILRDEVIAQCSACSSTGETNVS